MHYSRFRYMKVINEDEVSITIKVVIKQFR
jgi:hypothetical protein